MRYALVIFDMDGTLTEELLDFPAIRSDIGLPSDGGILEHLERMTGQERSRAEAILAKHELAAAENCALHEGALELLQTLTDRGVKTALLTRNSRHCAERILGRHGITLEHMSTREDHPPKPHADSILSIARKFRMIPQQTLMVGDYLYDLQAAANAGTHSVLLCTHQKPWPAFAGMATYRVRTLHEIVAIVLAAPNTENF